MRKALWLLTLLALAFTWFITLSALTGPNRLPDKIPTHFNAAGEPNAWGTSTGLYLLPALATGICLLLAVVGLNPSSFRYPIRITPENRGRLYALGAQTMAFLTVETALLFAVLQYSFLQAFRTNRFSLNPAIVPIFTGIILLTTVTHVVVMHKSN